MPDDIFRAIADRTREAILVTDGDGRIVYMNRAMADPLGLSVEEALGEAVPGDLADRLTRLLTDEETGRVVYSLSFPTGDGAAEERYRKLLENMPSGVAIYEVVDGGRDFVFRDFNRAAEEMDGQRREDLIGKSIFEVRPGAEEFGLIDVFRKVSESGSPTDHPIAVYKDGQRAGWYENRVYRVSTGEIVAVFDNATERMRTREDLSTSERRFKAVFDADMIGIGFWGANGEVFDANDAYLRLIKHSREDLEAKRINWRALTPREYLPVDAEAIRQILATGSCRPYEKEYLRHDGTRVNALIGGALIQREPVIGVAFALDITERLRLEEEVQKTQRLESLGVLAGGIAHDFNNLLGGMLGNIDLARRDVDDDSSAALFLDQALRAFERARALTRQLLTFSKGGAPVKKTIALEALLVEACALSLSGSNIGYRIDAAADLRTIEADPGQLHQVLSNLIINARQAMPDGGELIVGASNREIGDGEIPGLNGGSYVEVSVEDQGEGIPADVIDKVFDPFFTTKENGTGLGLATSHSIARRHGGAISIASTSKEGTVVRMLLPASEREPSDAAVRAALPEEIFGRVLVMDDEDLVLGVTRAILEQLGLSVVCARRGEEAVEAFEEAARAGRPFDLVIFDLTVPGGMGGDLAMARICEIDPGVPGIVASGYSNSPVMAQPERYGFAAKIAKPFRSAQLAAVVEKVLRARKATR